MKRCVLVLAGLFLGLLLHGKEASWKYSYSKGLFTVTLQMPRAVYYYREATSVRVRSVDGKEIVPREEPVFRVKADAISGDMVQVYPGPGNVKWVYTVPEKAYPVRVTLQWQGCADGSDGKEAVCFMPGEKVKFLHLSNGKLFQDAEKKGKAVSSSTSANKDKKFDLPAYTLVRSDSGYLPPEEFLAFLRGERKDSFAELGSKSFLLMALLIFLGGIALNLTPCVLPMIPINLAIIGGRDPSRKSSLFHGLTYGAGMALAYGVTGIAVILTQSTFGMLDSTWYFNAVTSVIFLLLGLSMFDVFTFDLSKYQGGVFRKLDSVRYAGVFFMGALTALLAGACVAPVVVAVLIQSGKMYNAGEFYGLFLPFILGLGMALPWPLAATGLSVLPKPGKWMKYVKYVLGVLILVLGSYYAFLAWEIAMGDKSSSSVEKAALSYKELVTALETSSKTGKKVFVDFTAQWCKNCKAMEKNVFNNGAVRRELENFIFVKVDATDLKDSLTEAILKEFEVKGLPSYRILQGK